MFCPDARTRIARQTAFRIVVDREHDLCMQTKIRSLRRPITHTVNGEVVTFLTIGYVAKAIGRTQWSVKHWQRLGLLPQPPFVLRPAAPEAKRGLYPQLFVKCLARIAKQDYVISRLDRKDWQRFQHEVWAAYEATVGPLLGAPGVTDEASTVAGTE